MSTPAADVQLDDDIDARAILRARAVALARAPAPQAAGELEQYVRLRLAGEIYGVPYRHVDEVLHISAIARVPCTPPAIAGIVNRRGELLTVLDLRAFFQVPEAATPGPGVHLVVVRAAGITAALRVDDIDGNDTYSPQELAPALPSEGAARMGLVAGIHAGTVAMLDLPVLLGDPGLTVDDRG